MHFLPGIFARYGGVWKERILAGLYREISLSVALTKCSVLDQFNISYSASGYVFS